MKLRFYTEALIKKESRLLAKQRPSCKISSMVSGLNSGERIDLGVGRYTQDFILLRDRITQRGCQEEEEEEEYSNRFKTWRESLAVLGINFRNLMNYN